MTNNYKGKRFLITQPMIYGYNGSTMVTIELAEYLQSRGSEVTVYTYAYDYPIKSEVDSKNIRVVVASDDDSLSLNDFDYIWVHSQVLPLSIIDELSRELPKNMPEFIFLHMSPFERIPDERPYIYQMEQKLASQVLVISEEVKDVLDKSFDADYKPKYKYYRNPAPACFKEHTVSNEKCNKVRRVLIVSNHPPIEVRASMKILNTRGIETVMFGEIGDRYCSITPEIISEFDVVVTIGKTVQYCLVMGKPVYVYDVFGGCGYLNNDNFDRAKKLNFSGRGFPKKNAEEIADDIESSYDRKFYSDNRQKFAKQFCISDVLSDIICDRPPLTVKQWSDAYSCSVRCCQMIARRDFCCGLSCYKQTNTIRQMSEDVAQVTKDLRRVQEEKERIQNDFNRVWRSNAYWVGRKIMKPFSSIKLILFKIKDKISL